MLEEDCSVAIIYRYPKVSSDTYCQHIICFMHNNSMTIFNFLHRQQNRTFPRPRKLVPIMEWLQKLFQKTFSLCSLSMFRKCKKQDLKWLKHIFLMEITTVWIQTLDFMVAIRGIKQMGWRIVLRTNAPSQNI